MAYCFLNNIYCLYFPAHCSHGMQPADNGPFNVLKGGYRAALGKLNSLTDSAPVDKVNFLRCYIGARSLAFTEKTIKGGFRVAGVWPISREKALQHPEIQNPVPRERTPTPDLEGIAALMDPFTPTNARQIMDFAIDSDPQNRLLFRKVARAFSNKALELVKAYKSIEALEETLNRLQRGRKRKKIPNPNKRFMLIGEALASGGPIAVTSGTEGLLVVASESEEDSDQDSIESIVEDPPESYQTRSGRMVRPKRHY